jgi:four helix bundle suffix protein
MTVESAWVVANIIICVIHQTCYLLDRQLKRLEQDFLKEGGLRERMTRARLAVRAKQGSWPTVVKNAEHRTFNIE